MTDLELLRLRASAKAKAARESLSSDESLQIMERQSPLVSDRERMKLMALGSPQGRVSSLRRDLRDKADVVLANGNVPASSGEGRILIREKDSPTGYWYPLDPQGDGDMGNVEPVPQGAPAGLGDTYVPENSETLKDVIEGIPDAASVGLDAGLGLLGSYSKAPQWLSKAMRGGPLKSAAIGGLVPAAVEALRQGAGSVAGIPNNMDPGEIGAVAASGGFGGLLFGAGNAEGLGGMGVRKFYKRAASRATGLPEKAIAALQKYLPEVERFEKMSGPDQLAEVSATRQAAQDQIKKVERETGNLLGGEFAQIDEAYDAARPRGTEAAADLISNTLGEALSKKEALKQELKAAKETGLSKEERRYIKNRLKVAKRDAKKLDSALGTTSKLAERESISGPISTDYILEPFENEKSRIIAQAQRNERGKLVPAAQEQIDTVNAVQNYIFGKNPKPTTRAIEAGTARQNLAKPAGAFTSERTAAKQEADEKLLKRSLTEARDRLRQQLSRLSNGRTEPLMDRYGTAAKGLEELERVFPGDAPGVKKFSQAASDNIDYATLQGLDSELGTDLADRAQFYDTVENFGRGHAPFAPTRWREVALPLTGGLAGYLTSRATEGEIPYGATIPLGMLGGYLTGTRGGIRAMTKYGPRIIEPAASQILRGGLWNAMRGQSSKEGKETR